MAEYKNVAITLTENSSAGKPPKVFSGQTIELNHEPDTVRTGVDGKVSAGRHPSAIVWYGGKASELKNVTDVRVVTASGTVLIDAGVNRHSDQPRDVAQGVRFLVL